MPSFISALQIHYCSPVLWLSGAPRGTHELQFDSLSWKVPAVHEALDLGNSSGNRHVLPCILANRKRKGEEGKGHIAKWLMG